MIPDPAPIPIEVLSSHYGLGAWQNCRPLAQTLNEHVRVTSDLGEVVVRRSRAEKTMADLRFEVELVDHVRAAGVPGPAFVRTRDELCGVEIAGSLYSVTWFVEGSAGRSNDPRHLPAMARMQARYHGAVGGFLPRVPSRARPSLLEQLDALVEKVGDLADTDLSTALSRGIAATDRIRTGAALPALVIQGGMERGSTLFEGGEIVAVLDLDSAYLDSRIIDIAATIQNLAQARTNPKGIRPIELDPATVERYLESYLADGSLTDGEIRSLPEHLFVGLLVKTTRRWRRIRSNTARPRDSQRLSTALARLGWLSDHLDDIRTAARSAWTRDRGDPEGGR
jgi:Ser/Thr protein kinase RdoA (MazF antagonist)